MLVVFLQSRATKMRALRVWNRALKHLDRIGANNHELYRVIWAASDAEHALRVLALYERIDAEKRGGVRRASLPNHRHREHR